VLNCEVMAIPKTPEGRYLINGEEYDVVVSTIAPDLIKKIVPELEIPAVTYRAAICPLLWLRSEITPYYWINMLDPDVPFSVIVNQQSLLPPNYYNGLYPLYIGHYLSDTSELFNQSNQELFAYYLGYLKKIFPRIEDEIVGYEIGRTKYAQPVVTAPWQPLKHTSNLPNIYTTSMAHIFPEDRGVNYAIREAKEITALLMEKYS
jgi:protoporphyrinogen oxidase